MEQPGEFDVETLSATVDRRLWSFDREFECRNRSALKGLLQGLVGKCRSAFRRDTAPFRRKGVEARKRFGGMCLPL